MSDNRRHLGPNPGERQITSLNLESRPCLSTSTNSQGCISPGTDYPVHDESLYILSMPIQGSSTQSLIWNRRPDWGGYECRHHHKLLKTIRRPLQHHDSNPSHYQGKGWVKNDAVGFGMDFRERTVLFQQVLARGIPPRFIDNALTTPW